MFLFLLLFNHINNNIFFFLFVKKARGIRNWPVDSVQLSRFVK